jgi:hypothetical protein
MGGRRARLHAAGRRSLGHIAPTGKVVAQLTCRHHGSQRRAYPWAWAWAVPGHLRARRGGGEKGDRTMGVQQAPGAAKRAQRLRAGPRWHIGHRSQAHTCKQAHQCHGDCEAGHRVCGVWRRGVRRKTRSADELGGCEHLLLWRLAGRQETRKMLFVALDIPGPGGVTVLPLSLAESRAFGGVTGALVCAHKPPLPAAQALSASCPPAQL